MNVKQRFQSAPLPGASQRQIFGTRLLVPSHSFVWRCLSRAFALLFLVGVPWLGLHWQNSLPQVVVTESSFADTSLVAGCFDPKSLAESVDLIVEGTVVQLSENDHDTVATIQVTRYVKGGPVSGDTVELVTLGSASVWVEDGARFQEGSEVRLYLNWVNGAYVISCGDMGVERISGPLSYHMDLGCNLQGEEAEPVPESLTLMPKEDSVGFEQMLWLPLGLREDQFSIEYLRSGSLIQVFEHVKGVTLDTEDPCSTWISGRVDGLEAGTYTFRFLFEDETSTVVLHEQTVALP